MATDSDVQDFMLIDVTTSSFLNINDSQKKNEEMAHDTLNDNLLFSYAESDKPSPSFEEKLDDSPSNIDVAAVGLTEKSSSNQNVDLLGLFDAPVSSSPSDSVSLLDASATKDANGSLDNSKLDLFAFNSEQPLQSFSQKLIDKVTDTKEDCNSLFTFLSSPPPVEAVSSNCDTSETLKDLTSDVQESQSNATTNSKVGDFLEATIDIEEPVSNEKPPGSFDFDSLLPSQNNEAAENIESSQPILNDSAISFTDSMLLNFAVEACDTQSSADKVAENTSNTSLGLNNGNELFNNSGLTTPLQNYSCFERPVHTKGSESVFGADISITNCLNQNVDTVMSEASIVMDDWIIVNESDLDNEADEIEAPKTSKPPLVPLLESNVNSSTNLPTEKIFEKTANEEVAAVVEGLVQTIEENEKSVELGLCAFSENVFGESKNVVPEVISETSNFFTNESRAEQQSAASTHSEKALSFSHTSQKETELIFSEPSMSNFTEAFEDNLMQLNKQLAPTPLEDNFDGSGKTETNGVLFISDTNSAPADTAIISDILLMNDVVSTEANLQHSSPSQRFTKLIDDPLSTLIDSHSIIIGDNEQHNPTAFDNFQQQGQAQESTLHVNDLISSLPISGNPEPNIMNENLLLPSILDTNQTSSSSDKSDERLTSLFSSAALEDDKFQDSSFTAGNAFSTQNVSQTFQTSIFMDASRLAKDSTEQSFASKGLGDVSLQNNSDHISTPVIANSEIHDEAIGITDDIPPVVDGMIESNFNSLLGDVIDESSIINTPFRDSSGSESDERIFSSEETKTFSKSGVLIDEDKICIPGVERTPLARFASDEDDINAINTAINSLPDSTDTPIEISCSDPLVPTHDTIEFLNLESNFLPASNVRDVSKNSTTQLEDTESICTETTPIEDNELLLLKQENATVQDAIKTIVADSSEQEMTKITADISLYPNPSCLGAMPILEIADELEVLTLKKTDSENVEENNSQENKLSSESSNSGIQEIQQESIEEDRLLNEAKTSVSVSNSAISNFTKGEEDQSVALNQSKSEVSDNIKTYQSIDENELEDPLTTFPDEEDDATALENVPAVSSENFLLLDSAEVKADETVANFPDRGLGIEASLGLLESKNFASVELPTDDSQHSTEIEVFVSSNNNQLVEDPVETDSCEQSVDSISETINNKLTIKLSEEVAASFADNGVIFETSSVLLESKNEVLANIPKDEDPHCNDHFQRVAGKEQLIGLHETAPSEIDTFVEKIYGMNAEEVLFQHTSHSATENNDETAVFRADEGLVSQTVTTSLIEKEAVVVNLSENKTLDNTEIFRPVETNSLLFDKTEADSNKGEGDNTSEIVQCALTVETLPESASKKVFNGNTDETSSPLADEKKQSSSVVDTDSEKFVANNVVMAAEIVPENVSNFADQLTTYEKTVVDEADDFSNISQTSASQLASLLIQESALVKDQLDETSFSSNEVNDVPENILQIQVLSEASRANADEAVACFSNEEQENDSLGIADATTEKTASNQNEVDSNLENILDLPVEILSKSPSELADQANPDETVSSIAEEKNKLYLRLADTDFDKNNSLPIQENVLLEVSPDQTVFDENKADCITEDTPGMLAQVLSEKTLKVDDEVNTDTAVASAADEKNEADTSNIEDTDSDEGSEFDLEDMNVSDMDTTDPDSDYMAYDSVSQVSLEFDDNPLTAAPPVPPPRSKKRTTEASTVPLQTPKQTLSVPFIPSSVYLAEEWREEITPSLEENLNLKRISYIQSVTSSSLPTVEKSHCDDIEMSSEHYLAYETSWEDIQHYKPQIDIMPVILEAENEDEEDGSMNEDEEDGSNASDDEASFDSSSFSFEYKIADSSHENTNESFSDVDVKIQMTQCSDVDETDEEFSLNDAEKATAVVLTNDVSFSNDATAGIKKDIKSIENNVQPIMDSILNQAMDVIQKMEDAEKCQKKDDDNAIVVTEDSSTILLSSDSGVDLLAVGENLDSATDIDLQLIDGSSTVEKGQEGDFAMKVTPTAYSGENVSEEQQFPSCSLSACVQNEASSTSIPENSKASITFDKSVTAQERTKDFAAENVVNDEPFEDNGALCTTKLQTFLPQHEENKENDALVNDTVIASLPSLNAISYDDEIMLSESGTEEKQRTVIATEEKDSVEIVVEEIKSAETATEEKETEEIATEEKESGLVGAEENESPKPAMKKKQSLVIATEDKEIEVISTKEEEQLVNAEEERDSTDLCSMPADVKTPDTASISKTSSEILKATLPEKINDDKLHDQNLLNSCAPNETFHTDEVVEEGAFNSNGNKVNKPEVSALASTVVSEGKLSDLQGQNQFAVDQAKDLLTVAISQSEQASQSPGLLSDEDSAFSPGFSPLNEDSTLSSFDMSTTSLDRYGEKARKKKLSLDMLDIESTASEELVEEYPRFVS